MDHSLGVRSTAYGVFTGIGLLVLGGLLSPGVSAQSVRVEDVSFYQESGTHVVVLYDLLADEDKTYTIAVALSKDGGRTFPLQPKALTGDAGDGVEAGRRRRIVWEFLKDYPGGLEGELAFDVTVVDASGGRGSSKTLFYGLLGAAVVGGGVAAAVLLGGGDGDGGGEGGGITIGLPPGRPAGN